MKKALIVGSSRGIGLELLKQIKQSGFEVTGTVRKQADMPALAALDVRLELTDIVNSADLDMLAAAMTEPLDLLVINAGIKEPAPWDHIDEAGIGHLFLTNALAPIRLAEALLPRMAPGGTIAFMSSRMGSVELTTADNLAMYRASKAALNSLTRGFAARLPAPHPVLTLHPGWVRTDMGGPGADLDVQTSVRGLVQVILAHRDKPGSHFLDYSGAVLPW